VTTHWADYTSKLNLTLNPIECALLVIDVQNSFCSPTGATARKHANTTMQALPAKINAFAERFHDMGGLLVYIRAMTDAESRSETQRWLDEVKGVRFPADPNDREYAFCGLEMPAGSVVLEKRCGDAFSSTNLKEILDARGVKYVLVSGVRTEICVRRAAERASSEGFVILIPRDLCATRDACTEHEDQALMFLNAYSGLVTTSDEVLGWLER
jgi:ureidoacrylate peracid hydrolase